MFYKLDAKLFPKHVFVQFGRSDDVMVFSDRYMKYGPKPILQESYRYFKIDPKRRVP
jgi:hypothetical protein